MTFVTENTGQVCGFSINIYYDISIEDSAWWYLNAGACNKKTQNYVVGLILYRSIRYLFTCIYLSSIVVVVNHILVLKVAPVIFIYILFNLFNCIL